MNRLFVCGLCFVMFLLLMIALCDGCCFVLRDLN